MCSCKRCRPRVSDEAWQTVQGLSVVIFLVAIIILTIRTFAPIVELP